LHRPDATGGQIAGPGCTRRVRGLMKLVDILEIVQARGLSNAKLLESGKAEPTGYSIDSRTVREGELFFAIRGENFDGHQFVANALSRGALAAIVSSEFFESATEDALKPKLIPCRNTLEALQSIAASVIGGWTGQEIAISGSMGKTTAKDLTALTLESAPTVRNAGESARVMKTRGNLNNAFGLPLSILKMESDGAHAGDFDFAVFEMGMNHKGELAELVRIAPPDVGVITVVAPVHLEFFSSADEIAEAKSEIIAGIKPGGVAVLNADDPRVTKMQKLRHDIEYCTFGIDQPADVSARAVRLTGFEGSSFRLVTPRGELDVMLPLAGRHNVYNALVAAAVADLYDAPLEKIAHALGRASSPKMRGEVLRLAGGITLIDDSYNSNPEALVEMVRTLAAHKDALRRIVVAGEMLELGTSGPELHREAGRRLAALGTDLLIGVRGLASEIVAGARDAGMEPGQAIFFASPEEAATFLESETRAGDAILVKGSRGVRAEIVVERMKQCSDRLS
jgi:UDP-N-acetylmuramoyl-tripeptide--D-alanyl-D-alanine ligase